MQLAPFFLGEFKLVHHKVALKFINKFLPNLIPKDYVDVGDAYQFLPKSIYNSALWGRRFGGKVFLLNGRSMCGS